MSALPHLVIAGVCVGVLASHAEEATPSVIDVSKFGAVPDSGKDATEAIRRAIHAAMEAPKPVILSFPVGRYDLYDEKAVRRIYHVSNTAPETVSSEKVIGILLDGASDITIDGHGSLLMFHSKMTMLVADHCKDITFRNISFDFARPTVSEFRVERISGKTMDVVIGDEYPYSVENNRLIWLGGNVSPDSNLAQQYDPIQDRTWRRWDWNPIQSAKSIEEIGPHRVRLTYDHTPDAQVGAIFQFRDGVRDQVGAFINRSKNISFLNVGMHFAHGLGIVSQFSENVSFDHLVFTPRPSTGRTCAGYADFLQFVGCRDRVSITNSAFAGAQDDAINVHGMFLQVQSKEADDKIIVRFMHPQSWGYDAFAPGDDIEFVNKDSLTSFGSGRVSAVQQIDGRNILLTLERPVPTNLRMGADCVENVTWTPSVVVKNCRFARVPTRGILVTTRQPVLIEGNTFWRLPMSSILIADDAGSWFESGAVHNVRITGNTFAECSSPVISIAPENSDAEAERPVHRQIDVEHNLFRMPAGMAIDAKSVQGLTLKMNTFEGPDWNAETMKHIIQTEACTDVSVSANIVSHQ